ncbi:hypothetical protein [Ligilactobacillus cholophilus]|uniref:hypothetical protein n=1 Tax=Ligilactobacillus cholophilus TaxID=3050131 RepID=UPI0025B07AA9|nr:hypothetical protein [Ligilactobacillus cholophilus]
MANYIISYDNKGCRKVFKTYRHQEKVIKKTIEKQITRQMETDFSKVKLATRIEVNGLKCYECRVNPPQLPPVRVAFTRDGNKITICYITTNIVKADFTHELEHFLGGK